MAYVGSRQTINPGPTEAAITQFMVLSLLSRSTLKHAATGSEPGFCLGCRGNAESAMDNYQRAFELDQRKLSTLKNL